MHLFGQVKMTCQDSLVSLLDELLTLFEGGNKVVYKRILILRHRIRTEEAERVYEACRNFYLDHSQCFSIKDVGVFKHTPFHSDIELIWPELSPPNKSLVWKWIESIANDLA
jgi:hypothetical protein